MRLTLRGVAAATAAAALLLPLGTAEAAQTGTVRSAVALTVPSTVTYGGSGYFTGVVGRPGTGKYIPGARVVLQRATPGHQNWSTVSSGRTNSHGGYGFSVDIGRPFSYRVVHPADATYAGSVSPARTPGVRPVASLHKFWDDYPFGHDELHADAMVYPGRAGRPVYLQRYDAKSNSFRNIGFKRTPTEQEFRVDAENVAGSTAYYRLYAPAFDGYTATVSYVHRYTHYSARGAFKRALVATGGTNHPTFAPWPAERDPGRYHAAVYAGRGGSAWADLNVAGCKGITYWLQGVDGTGGDTKIEVIVDGKVVYTENVSGSWTGQILPYDTYVNGRKTVRFKVSDVNTKTGPRAVLNVSSYCSY